MKTGKNRTIYIATGYTDGLTLAARCAADLPAHGLKLVKDGDWWNWPPIPSGLSRRGDRAHAQTILWRQTAAMKDTDAMLVLLTPNAATGTGAEIRWMVENQKPVFWIRHGWPLHKEIPLWLRAGYGDEVSNLVELAAGIAADAEQSFRMGGDS